MAQLIADKKEIDFLLYDLLGTDRLTCQEMASIKGLSSAALDMEDKALG